MANRDIYGRRHGVATRKLVRRNKEAPLRTGSAGQGWNHGNDASPPNAKTHVSSLPLFCTRTHTWLIWFLNVLSNKQFSSLFLLFVVRY